MTVGIEIRSSKDPVEMGESNGYCVVGTAFFGASNRAGCELATVPTEVSAIRSSYELGPLPSHGQN
jgi:hypothetical protein